MEESDIASFRDKDLGIVHAPKMCLDQSQAFKEVNSNRAFTVGRRKEKEKHDFFLTEPLPGVPRHVCTEFSANIRRIDCIGPILSHIYRHQIESAVNTSDYDAKP